MSVTFLKAGKEAHVAVAKAEKETAAKKAAAGEARRFWLPNDAETQITFLDGDLLPEGLIDTVTFWEHQLKLNGSWQNWFVCTKDDEPCPICEDSDKYSSLITLFTVIDHTKWTDKQNVVHQHERRLFACKRDTFKRLQKLATKRKGLVGVTFDVARTGDKSAAVGNDFDFVEKLSLEDIGKKYNLKEKDLKPFDYSEVIKYHTADELRELGFGSNGAPIGQEAAKQAVGAQEFLLKVSY